MDGKIPAVSYFQKSKTVCPVCDTGFYREELLTGRGRLIAGNLTTELRRLYEPSKKYGKVNPLVYPVTVCPNCYYAAWKDDFLLLPEASRERAEEEINQRIDLIGPVLGGIDFRANRHVEEGLASFILATHCYDYFRGEQSPVMKQGISSLRAAWLALDKHEDDPEGNYLYLAALLYRKAHFFYATALEYEQKGVQSIGGCPNLGPDLDKNYGYDGVIYLTGYLEYHHGPTKDPEIRHRNLERAKRMVARIFGMGKASRSKPQAILDNARDLYQEINRVLGVRDADPEKDAQADV
ncbi:DUF2225 domain-containing protein [Spirochaeta lutea]|uniref:Membrane protein n=1 Tax=Spirochaeta lutea TaxID=1480694 RepID=A0A098QYA9_9SPIO|nr:DUF2225 domain-containing protein [Spirochaeta lutea]KGE72830.1 membrane protein [Spirochaeta lutea]